VNAIAPGFIETDMTAVLTEEQKQKMLEHIALKRLGKPEDIAAMATFLASDEAEWVTGTAMVVDGGMNTGNARINFAPGYSGPSFQRPDRTNEPPRAR